MPYFKKLIYYTAQSYFRFPLIIILNANKFSLQIKKKFPNVDPEAMFKIPETFDYVE